ncbi:MAG: hypothetical protein ACRC30_07390 [Clostridium sp.]
MKFKVSYNFFEAIKRKLEFNFIEEVSHYTYILDEQYIHIELINKNINYNQIILKDDKNNVIEKKDYINKKIKIEDIIYLFKSIQEKISRGNLKYIDYYSKKIYEYIDYQNDKFYIFEYTYDGFSEYEIEISNENQIIIQIFELIEENNLYKTILSNEEILLIANGIKSQQELVKKRIKKLEKEINLKNMKPILVSSKHNNFNQIINVENSLKEEKENLMEKLKKRNYFYQFNEYIKQEKLKSEYNINFFITKEKNEMIKNIYNDINYMYNLKLINHPEVLTSNKDYTIYNILDDIYIGKYTFSGIINKYQTYIYYCKSKKEFNIFVDQQINLVDAINRTIRTFFSLYIHKLNGIAIHASSVIHNNKAVLIIGEKYSGKTTNMLAALSINNCWDFQSNDLVHLVNENSQIITYGSDKSIGIRFSSFRILNDLHKKINKAIVNGNKLAISKEYGCKFTNKINLSLTHLKDANIFLTPKELTELLNKEIVIKSNLAIIIIPSYNDGQKEDFILEELDSNYLESVLEKNMILKYNTNQPFWDNLLPHIDNKHLCKTIASQVKGYKVTTNSTNIDKLWKYISKLEILN